MTTIEFSLIPAAGSNHQTLVLDSTVTSGLASLAECLNLTQG